MTQQPPPDPGSYPTGSPAPDPAPPPVSPPPGSPPPGTSPAVGWSPSKHAETTVSGLSGLVYADVPNRVFALIVDAIILGIGTAVITSLVYGIVGSPVTFSLATGVVFNAVPLLIGAVISLAISAAYYIYTWTSLRASPGQRLLGMQVGNFPDGAPLTQNQAIRRWAVLFAPFSLGQVAYVAPTIGPLVGLLIVGYAVYLLYTTAQSPTKQGFHDKTANSVVVKAARSV